MTTSLHSESTVVFKRFLANLRKILEKARDHAAAHKIDEAAILGDRLFPDMFPMSRQVQIASDAAKGAVARLAGLEIPSFADTEASFDELIARIDKTLAFIDSVPASAFDGAGQRQIVLTFPSRRLEFTGADYLRTWALPNFYFHIATAYGLLRSNGVPVGKMDYLG
ncbi:MAG: DUF1993 domain-containing protein [Betaproteobacteria bacterium]|nr:DUF1993 domain-containing protein [Betaproteobacteria bacterium]